MAVPQVSAPRRAAGTGSIRAKSDGVWLIQTYRGRDELGRPRYVTRTVRGTREDAEQALAAETVVSPVTTKATGYTVRQLLADYLDDRQQAGISPRSLDYIESTAENHLNPSYGDLGASGVTLRDVNALVMQLGAKGLHPASVRRIVGVLSAAYSHANRTELLTSNPCVHATKPSVRRDDRDAPSAEVIARLLDVANWNPDLWRGWDRQAFRLYLLLSAATGARRGEVLALRWRDIDTKAKTVHFRARVVESSNGIEVLPGTKSGRGRKLSADAGTLAALTAHRTGINPEAFIFGGDQPWRPSAVSNKYRRHRDDVGAQGVKLHHLRHWCATNLLQNGAAITDVSRYLGHSRTSTTLDVYSHAVPGNDQALADTIGALLHRTA